MCGIAGVLDLRHREAVSPRLMRDMARVMSHRGPDDEGVYTRENLGLAHRRLSIIDLSSAGHQPMVSAGGSTVLVYNGMLYNYQELRAELQARGHRFVSQSDTEVILHGWEEYGKDLLPKLNGHFAFAVWDEKRRALFLVRDRFGTKPLYYANLGGLWIFASEIKAILKHPAYSFGLNHDALFEYFTFQNQFRYHTMFEGINLVPPANVFTIPADGGAFNRRSYWDYDFCFPDPNLTREEAEPEVRRLLSQAVKRQLTADVPVGSYLSGGLDSGSIVSVAAGELDRMNTFTCGWHLGGVEGVERGFDERAAAELMAYIFKTEHFEQVIGHSDSAVILPELVYHLEDLRMGMSYGNYYAARLASKFVKVCLSGAGGDELFGGYPWRYYRVAGSLDKQAYFDNYYDYWQRLVPDEIRPGFFTGQTLSAMGDRDMKRVLSRVFTFHPGLRFDRAERHVENSLYFEAKTFLHGLLLVGDRMAMAHGLEERFPFLDNDLVDFAVKVPVNLKIRDIAAWTRQDENMSPKVKSYFARHDDGKNVLRQAVSRWIPDEVVKRHKQGFSSPDESWYRGPNLQYVRDTLLDKRALFREFIDHNAVERLLEEHMAKKVNRRLLIWSLLCFEMWLKTFALGDRPAPQATA